MTTMQLTDFIRKNETKIIAEWIEFARTILPWATGMPDKELQDHAAELLRAVVSDMEAPQSKAEQSEKSQGQAAAGSALAKVGHKHASQRLISGFDLNQLVSEYRALRASILRLWAESHGEKQSQVTRFNEAIDESLTEATVRYSEILGHTRDQFLAILGHDLRNPLGAIVTGATMLTKAENLEDKQVRIATRILTSAGRMDRMVSDLLDLTRTRLGDGIPVNPSRMDLTTACQQVLAEFEATHPGRALRFEASGDLRGSWDSDRLTQVISNLVANAFQHGSEAGPVTVVADGRGEAVVLSVHNEGPVISAQSLTKIFEPMVRQPTKGTDRNASGMGLGLYIAREIATAHGGTIEVTSTEKAGTTFTVELPRHPPDKARAEGG